MQIFDEETQTIPIPANLQKGPQTAQWVLDQITAYPDTHDQDNWAQETGCGTTFCVAGWAAAVHGGEFLKDYVSPYASFQSELNDRFEWRKAGKEALQIEEYVATELFSACAGPGYVTAILVAIASGVEPDWDFWRDNDSYQSS